MARYVIRNDAGLYADGAYHWVARPKRFPDTGVTVAGKFTNDVPFVFYEGPHSAGAKGWAKVHLDAILKNSACIGSEGARIVPLKKRKR